MNLDAITQYLLAILPSVTAVASCVGAIAVSIHKVKKVTRDSERRIETARTTKTNRELADENKDLRREVTELKALNHILTYKLKGIRIEDGKPEE